MERRRQGCTPALQSGHRLRLPRAGRGSEGKQRQSIVFDRRARSARKRPDLRRENKLALIVGFSVLLVVAVLVSDHLSTARQLEMVDGLDTLPTIPDGRAFIESPLASDGRVGLGDRIASDDDRGSRLDTGTQRAVRQNEQQHSVVPDRIATNQPAEGPVEINNGSGSNRVAARTGGISGVTGIDRSVVEEFLRRGNQPVLVQPIKRSSAGSVEKARSDKNERTKPAAVRGHVPRDNKYVVQPNDTLYEICEKLYGDGTKWREVAAINKGKVSENGFVYEGVTLRLLDDTKTVAVRTPAAGKAAPKQAESTRTYTIKKGDTLSQIVQREVGSVRDLDRVRALNPWLKKQKDGIRTGQKLTLPATKHASAQGR